MVRFTGPISVERPSRCPTCCLKCPGGVCTATCNKQLLKEIFAKMYEANAGRIQKLQYFIKANKQRITTSESRVEKCAAAPLLASAHHSESLPLPPTLRHVCLG